MFYSSKKSLATRRNRTTRTAATPTSERTREKAAAFCREADCVFMYEPGTKDRTIGVWFHHDTEEDAVDRLEDAITMGLSLAKITGTVLSPDSLKSTKGKSGVDKFVFGNKIRLRFAADSNAKIQKVAAEVKKLAKEGVNVVTSPSKERVYRGLSGPGARKAKAPKAKKGARRAAAAKAPKARKALGAGKPLPRGPSLAPKAPRAPKAPKVPARADGIFLHENTVEVVRGGAITFSRTYETPAKAAASARMASINLKVPVTKANPRRYGYHTLPGRSYYQPRTLTSGMTRRSNRGKGRGRKTVRRPRKTSRRGW